MGRQVEHVDQRLGRRRSDDRARSGGVTAEADVVLDDPPQRTDRLEPHARIGGRDLEREVELRRQLLVGRHGHVVPPLLPGVRSGDLAPRREAAGIRRRAGRQRHRPDERIEHSHRAPREVVEVVALTHAGLIVGDVGVATDVDEPAAVVEHGEREIAAESVGVVDVEHRRERLAGVVHARDRLDLLVVERERVPVDVGRRGDPAGDADRVAVGLQQIAHVLGRAVGVVRVDRGFAGLAREEGVARQSLHVDARRRIADVGIPHRRARLLVRLPQAEAEFVAAARRAVGEARGIGQRGLVVRGRGGGVVPRLAPHADEVRRRGADGTGQHDPHARVARIERVEVAAPPGILAEGLGDAPRRRRQRALDVAVLELDHRRNGGGIRDRDLAGGGVEAAAHRGGRRLAEHVAEREHPVGSARESLHRHGGQGIREIVDHAGKRFAHGAAVGERVDGVSREADVQLEIVVHHAAFQRGVDGPGEHVSGGVEQLDHRVERRRGLVEIEPDLRARRAGELVGVDVGRGVGGDGPVHLESEASIRVARLLLSAVRGVRPGREVARQHSERLGVGHGVIPTQAAGVCLLRLDGDRHVAIVRIRHER